MRPASAIAPAARFPAEFEADAVGLGLMAVTGNRVVRDLTEVNGYECDIERAAAQAGKVEEVPDQAFEPLRLPFDHFTRALR